MGMPFSLAVVLVAVLIVALVVILISVLVVILVVVLIVLVAVLVIHCSFLRYYLSAACRCGSFPINSGFILRFENQTYQKCYDDRRCDPACAGGESSGKDPYKTVTVNGFFYTLSQGVAKSR